MNEVFRTGRILEVGRNDVLDFEGNPGHDAIVSFGNGETVRFLVTKEQAKVLALNLYGEVDVVLRGRSS